MDEEELVDSIADAIDDEIDDLTTQLELGELTPEEWEEAVQDALEDGYIQQAALAAGGRRRVSPLILGLIAVLLARQFGWLDRLTQLISTGQVSPAEVRRRMAMYANSSRQSYWTVRDRMARAAGMTEENWHAIGDKNTCSPCTDADAMGWQPLGTFGAPGSGIVLRIMGTLCHGLTFCRCRKSYR